MTDTSLFRIYCLSQFISALKVAIIGHAIDISPDIFFACGTWNNKVKLFDIYNGNIIHLWEGRNNKVKVNQIKYSESGKYIATASWDNLIRVLLMVL